MDQQWTISESDTMARPWSASKYPGIRYRLHESRSIGTRRDRYFAIYYRLDGKRIEEGVGWESAGWTEGKVNALLAELKENQRTGKRPQTLREQAELAALQRQEEAARRQREALANISFAQFWVEFYAPSASASKKSQTWHNEQGHFTNWIAPVIGETPLRSVTTFALERINKHLIEKKRAAKTQHAVLATCRQVFNLAARHGLIEVNPVTQMTLPRQDNRRQRHLSHQEARELLALTARRSPQLHDICLLSLHTGLRAGEIFKLRWEDVNFETGTLLVRDPKSGKNRYAYLTQATRTMLIHRKDEASSPPLFQQADGSPLREVSRTFERIVEELGWNQGQADPRLKVVFHTLRHTFASWHVQQGTPLYTVAKLMGHASLTMTERYSHLAPEGLRAAMREFEQTIAAAPVSAFTSTGLGEKGG